MGCEARPPEIQNYTYTDATYGFTLKFPQAWKSYVAKKRELNWGTLGISASVDFGFMEQDSLFNISSHTKDQWQKIKSEEGPMPTYLGENSYVFGYSITQDATNKTMAERIKEIPSILTTFRVK